MKTKNLIYLNSIHSLTTYKKSDVNGYIADFITNLHHDKNLSYSRKEYIHDGENIVKHFMDVKNSFDKETQNVEISTAYADELKEIRQTYNGIYNVITHCKNKRGVAHIDMNENGFSVFASFIDGHIKRIVTDRYETLDEAVKIACNIMKNHL